MSHWSVFDKNVLLAFRVTFDTNNCERMPIVFRTYCRGEERSRHEFHRLKRSLRSEIDGSRCLKMQNIQALKTEENNHLCPDNVCTAHTQNRNKEEQKIVKKSEKNKGKNRKKTQD